MSWERDLTMLHAADKMARLALAACAEMAAGGGPEPGLELLSLPPLDEGGAAWRMSVGFPGRARPHALVALAMAGWPETAEGPSLPERLARLAAATRTEAFPLFGIRDGEDEPAAAVLLPPEEMEPDRLPGHVARLMAALEGSPPHALAPDAPAAPAAPEPALMGKGWERI